VVVNKRIKLLAQNEVEVIVGNVSGIAGRPYVI